MPSDPYPLPSPAPARMAPLPWHYLGDIAAVLYYRVETARTGCKKVLRESDLRSLLNDPAPITSRHGEHPAIVKVRKKVEAAEKRGERRPWAGWDSWPERVEVKVRRGIPARLPTEAGGEVARRDHDYILGPTHLVLPWPFRNVQDHEAPAVQERYHVEDWNEDEDYDPRTDVLGDVLLSATDSLVDPPDRDPCVPRVLVWPGDPEVRGKLLKTGGDVSEGFDLPSSAFAYAVDLPSVRTHFEIGERALALVVGASLPKSDCQPAEPKRFGPAEVVMTEYPCGGFGSGSR